MLYVCICLQEKCVVQQHIELVCDSGVYKILLECGHGMALISLPGNGTIR